MELVIVSGIQVLALMVVRAADYLGRVRNQDVVRPDGDGWLPDPRKAATNSQNSRKLEACVEFDAAA